MVVQTYILLLSASYNRHNRQIFSYYNSTPILVILLSPVLFCMLTLLQKLRIVKPSPNTRKNRKPVFSIACGALLQYIIISIKSHLPPRFLIFSSLQKSRKLSGFISLHKNAEFQLLFIIFHMVN